ncbi:MAG: DUF3253 domain-containing protein [Pseudomonadota bacterium]
MLPTDQDIAAALIRFADQRIGSSFCPSEVARDLAEDWRPLMGDIRRVAADLGLKATQRGATVDPILARGPIRLRRA